MSMERRHTRQCTCCDEGHCSWVMITFWSCLAEQSYTLERPYTHTAHDLVYWGQYVMISMLPDAAPPSVSLVLRSNLQFRGV